MARKGAVVQEGCAAYERRPGHMGLRPPERMQVEQQQTGAEEKDGL